MKTRLISLALFGAGLLAVAPQIRASVSIGEKQNVQIGGFFSQGYIKSNGNNYPITSKNGSDEFRDMGFNASTSFGSHVRVGAQVFAQRFGPYGDDKALLDWAVVDYNFNQAFGVRAGRVKYPKGLYGEALDLDVVRPFIFLPFNLYNPILRDFAASFDGAMVYGTLTAGKNSFDYKVFYGDIPMKPEQGVADFFNNTSLYAYPAGVTKLGMDHVAGSSLYWNTPVSGLKVGLSYSYFKSLQGSGRSSFAPAFIPVAPVNVLGERFAYSTVSTEYVKGNWTFASEFQRSNTKFKLFLPPGFGPPSTTFGKTDAWYFAASRRINRWIELGSYYTSQKSSGPANTDIALSVRFDVNDHLLFKLEGHAVDGFAGGVNTPRLPNPPATRKDKTNFWAAKTTLTF